MPLTFAHPAAVLPLTRLRLPLSALVVGSVAPDLVYFVRLAPRGHFGHTLPGLFLFCIPAGLALLWVFDRLLKRPLAELAPASAQRRLNDPLRRSPFDRPLAFVAVAVLLGATTHVLWDAFTHAGGWGVALVPALRRTVSLGSLGAFPAYKLAQHGSTVFGLSALTTAAAMWWRQASQSDVHPRLSARERVLRLGLLVSVALVVGTTYAGAVAAGAASPLPVFVGRFVVSVTSAAFVAVTAYSFWSRTRSAPAG